MSAGNLVNVVCCFTSLHSPPFTIVFVAIVAPPGPRPRAFIGNADWLLGDPVAGFARLHEKYGDVVKYRIFAKVLVQTIDAAMAEEVLTRDDTFRKEMLGAGLELVEIGGGGLFTTNTHDARWWAAHRVLMPAFSAAAMKQYVPTMIAATGQLCSLLDAAVARNDVVDVCGVMTKLTFETIGRCGFGFSFGALQAPHDAPLHPFLTAMSFCLGQVLVRVQRSKYWKRLPLASNREFRDAMNVMRQTVNSIIDARTSDLPHPKTTNADRGGNLSSTAATVDSSEPPSASTSVHNDLLQYMLTTPDPATGKPLDRVNVVDQVITFLVAGHETTSNLLSWALWLLSQHPAAQRRAVDEARAALALRDATLAVRLSAAANDLKRLTFIDCVLRETLRLYPPVVMVQARCFAEGGAALGGRYGVECGEVASILVTKLHRNKKYAPANCS